MARIRLFGKRRFQILLSFLLFSVFWRLWNISTFEYKGMYKQHQHSFNMKNSPDRKSVYYDLHIIVIVSDRAKSLLRLLNSLNEAVYFGDRVLLEVWIDRSRNGRTIDSTTYVTAVRFTFNHGEYFVHNHTSHVGLYGQWLTTWNPSTGSDEIAVILEDDLTVSPFFYKWLKLVHRKYDNISSINGFTLQGEASKFGIHSRKGFVQAPSTEVVFLFPILGSWGFSPKKDKWIKFTTWYFRTIAQDKKFVPLVPGIQHSQWYKTWIQLNKTHTMWTMWHIYYAFHNKEETLWGNFHGRKGLASHWKEKGVHYKGGERPTPLLTEWKKAYEDLPDQPVHLDVDSNVVPQYDPFAYVNKKGKTRQ